MSCTQISLNQSNQIKGLAILLIVFHNCLVPMIGCGANEMFWMEPHVDTFISGLKTVISPLYIFAYLGWYGVPLFVFLSGYGLSIKYGDRIKSGNGRIFLFSQWKKLVLLMLPVLLAFPYAYAYIFNEAYPSQLLWQVPTMTANIFNLQIIPGTFWFFGMIFQLYVIFLIINKLKWGRVHYLLIFTAIFILFQYYLLYGVSTDTMWWMRHNCIAWFPSFFLGMMAARVDITLPKPLAAVGLLLFGVMSVFKWFHPLNELLFILSVVSLVYSFRSKTLLALGIISPYLFVLNSPIRQVLCAVFNTWSIYILFVVIVAVCLVASYAYMSIEKYIKLNLNKH